MDNCFLSGASEICNEALWKNSMISSNGASLFNRQFTARGILTTIETNLSELPLGWNKALNKSILRIIFGLFHNIMDATL